MENIALGEAPPFAPPKQEQVTNRSLKDNVADGLEHPIY